MRREDVRQPNDAAYRAVYKALFGDLDNLQLGKNKGVIIKNFDDLKDTLHAVSGWCEQLKSLLRDFSTILHAFHTTHNFPVDDVYVAFGTALQKAEQHILAHPIELTPEQARAYEAEVKRRAADLRDWELPTQTEWQPNTIPEENEEEPTVATNARAALPTALQALRLFNHSPQPHITSESAGSRQTATDEQRQRSSQLLTCPQASEILPTANNTTAVTLQPTKSTTSSPSEAPNT